MTLLPVRVDQSQAVDRTLIPAASAARWHSLKARCRGAVSRVSRVRSRSAALAAAALHPTCTQTGTAVGIRIGIQRVLVGPLIALYTLCLLPFLNSEGWQSGRMRRPCKPLN